MGADRIRLDKWLWFARFFRTRTLASEVVTKGYVRVNGNRITKPAQLIGPGDILTLRQGRAIRVVRIIGLAERRGSAPDAQALYEEMHQNNA